MKRKSKVKKYAYCPFGGSHYSVPRASVSVGFARRSSLISIMPEKASRELHSDVTATFPITSASSLATLHVHSQGLIESILSLKFLETRRQLLNKVAISVAEAGVSSC